VPIAKPNAVHPLSLWERVRVRENPPSGSALTADADRPFSLWERARVREIRTNAAGKA